MRHLYGRAWVRGAIEDETLITIAGSTIESVVQTRDVPRDAERTSALIVPGFIDLHIHGGDGADFMDADERANARILAFHARNGTTAMMATTLSGSVADLANAVAAIARSSDDHGAEIAGIHLEGPYINRDRAGAQDRASIRPADIQEIASLLERAPRLKWMITFAPEIDGARALVERFRERVVFSIGHTSADYAEAVAALEWGATHFTHLFNAMTGMHHREPGVVGAALVSRSATAELIADGIHVHPAVLNIAATTIPHRIALVTDAMRACGLADGTYKLYGQDVDVKEGAAHLRKGGALAGSTLTMHGAVRNMVELAGLPIERVIPLATEVPARIIGVRDRKGVIDRGYDADLVLLDKRLDLERVIVRGEEVKR
jgi:N-acetylglucosamine-6-phosphate deacetylase